MHEDVPEWVEQIQRIPTAGGGGNLNLIFGYICLNITAVGTRCWATWFPAVLH